MIARQSFLVILFRYLTRIIGWIGLIVLAKLWGGFAPEAIGSVAFAMSFVAMFSVLSDLGFSKAHVKRISEGKDTGECISVLVVTKIFLSIIMVASILIFIFVFENFYGGTISDATTKLVIYIIIVYHIVLSFRGVAVSTFNGTKEIAKRQIVMIFENITKVPLMIIVALMGVSSVSYTILSPVQWPQFIEPIKTYISQYVFESLAITYVLGIFSSFVVGILFLRKYSLKRPSFKMFKSYFVFALPIMMLSIVGTISLNIDKIMIGYFWTSVEVGYYFTVQQISGIILIVSGAIGVLLFPAFSEYHIKNNFDNIRKIAYKAERYISMVTVPFVVVVIIFAKPIIEVMLSSSFIPAYSTLMILSIYSYVVSIYTVYSSLILGINKPSVSAKIGISMFLVNIVLNYLFIPRMGMLSIFNIYGPSGASVATLLSIIFGYCYLRVITKKYMKIKMFNIFTVSHVFSGVITAIVLYYTSILFESIYFYQLICFSIFGFVLYASILYLIKELKRDDFHFFFDLFNPKKMVKYMSSELKNKPKS